VSPLLLVVVSFVAMEAVSYAAHRWVMHGVGMVWHRSHHAPKDGLFEKNDLFPVVFSSVGILLFALGAGGANALWWVAIGVTLYGAVYTFIHEVYIHHRLPLRLPRLAYLEWLRESHRDHHLTGEEPYGMLLPLVRSRVPEGRRAGYDPLERRAVTPVD
jgi:beta-carotene 3-hydroxylase